MNADNVSVRAIDLALLPTAERLFLWATRAWSAYHSDLTAVWWSLDRAFRQEQIHLALPIFHQLMSSLFDGLRRWPDIRCVACSRVGLHEARLLMMYMHLQRGNEVAARSALQDWVVRSAARSVCEHARQCTVIASTAGLSFQFMAFGCSTQAAHEIAQPVRALATH